MTANHLPGTTEPTPEPIPETVHAPVPTLSSPLLLRSGITIKNRIVKAAMEEQLAGPHGHPDERLVRLYERWDQGGAGIMITGHVMVDRAAIAQPADVILDARSNLQPFKRWARTAKHGSLWMQINHPGRVVQRDTGSKALAPSAIPVNIGSFSKLFATPSPATEADIHRVIEQFATTAKRADDAGFTGVEIHAAHGYLLAQFLSPLTNTRTDQWGGTLQNRARLLLTIVAAIREQVPPGFGIAVKLNSADFQRGGFDIIDAHRVITWLSDSVDFIELSGGSVESLATSGHPADHRTLDREAYFLSLTTEIATTTTVPLMLTGGIRRGTIAQQVLASGFALAGSATAIAQHPNAPHHWIAGHDSPVTPPHTLIRNKTLRAAAIQATITHHIRQLSKPIPRPALPPLLALSLDQYRRNRALHRHQQEQTNLLLRPR